MLINCRPISLLATLSKVLEKLMSTRIYKYIEKMHQFSKCQYGLRANHNCEQAIMNLVGKIIHGMNSGKLTVSLYLNLSKAFDTLNHNVLVKKLERYGIRGVAKDCLVNYLSNRKIRCKIQQGSKDHKSGYYDMSKGTPQGSWLGPLLFLLFINDLQLND